MLNLPAGDYTLTVDGPGDTTGAYSFRLLDLAAGDGPDARHAGQRQPHPGQQTDLYRFTAAAGDRFFFDVQARGGPAAPAGG